MSYHISTYGYTHKKLGCKRTGLDFRKPYWKKKIKNAKVFWTLAFFFVPKFGAPRRIRTPGQELRRFLLYPTELWGHGTSRIPNFFIAARNDGQGKASLRQGNRMKRITL